MAKLKIIEKLEQLKNDFIYYIEDLEEESAYTGGRLADRIDNAPITNKIDEIISDLDC